jgi:predicted nucleotidyltransferase
MRTVVVDVIRSTLNPFVARIVSAFLYGSIVKTEGHEKSDVNLMIVGGGHARKRSPHRDPRAGNAMDFALGQPLLLE